MRHWGIVITGFYALVVIFLFTFGADVIIGDLPEDGYGFLDVIHSVQSMWVFLLILVCGQVLLLFLSVDTSWRRMKAQRHAKITAGLVGLMVSTLFVAVFFALGMAYSGDDFIDFQWLTSLPGKLEGPVLFLMAACLWIFWGLVFYKYFKRDSGVINSAVNWLIRGSVLQLLIAVPCHIIIRQREECCAPFISAYGIATGIAIMLLAFGPGALLLYRRKLDEYKRK